MVLQFDERPQPTYRSTLGWIVRGALNHYRHQLTALGAVLALAWPAATVAIVAREWLHYGWLAVLAWGLLTGLQAANFLRQYTVSMDLDSLSRTTSRRRSISPQQTVGWLTSHHGGRWLYVTALFGVSTFLVCLLLVGELAGRLFGPAGMLAGVVALQALEGLLNNRNRSLAVPGVKAAERLLVIVKEPSAHQRQLLSGISDDLSSFLADGVLGFWRVG